MDCLIIHNMNNPFTFVKHPLHRMSRPGRRRFCRTILNQVDPNLPSGKHTQNYGKIHHFSWENPLFRWPCSIVFCMFTRGFIL